MDSEAANGSAGSHDFRRLQMCRRPDPPLLQQLTNNPLANHVDTTWTRMPTPRWHTCSRWNPCTRGHWTGRTRWKRVDARQESPTESMHLHYTYAALLPRGAAKKSLLNKSCIQHKRFSSPLTHPLYSIHFNFSSTYGALETPPPNLDTACPSTHLLHPLTPALAAVPSVR